MWIFERFKRTSAVGWKSGSLGFTLLEVMIALAIMSIALVAVFGLQSRSVTLANEAIFVSTAALLAQSKIAEIETKARADLISDSGDFGDDYVGFFWEISVSDLLGEDEGMSSHLKRIDLILFLGKDQKQQYKLRLYRFLPKAQ